MNAHSEDRINRNFPVEPSPIDLLVCVFRSVGIACFRAIAAKRIAHGRRGICNRIDIPGPDGELHALTSGEKSGKINGIDRKFRWPIGIRPQKANPLLGEANRIVPLPIRGHLIRRLRLFGFGENTRIVHAESRFPGHVDDGLPAVKSIRSSDPVITRPPLVRRKHKPLLPRRLRIGKGDIAHF